MVMVLLRIWFGPWHPETRNARAFIGEQGLIVRFHAS
jgi:hypothetical protein